MLRFILILVVIFLLSLGLRFWNLGQFNTLVFDEVYYAKFANHYLTQTPFFNSHPPLTEYLIALGMWLGSWFQYSSDITNNLTGSWRSTISYRWLNALTGSFFSLILGAIAYQLTHRRSLAIIVSLLAGMEGLFLVESRYALNNIYLVTFGLLGHLFFLLFLNQEKYFYLTLSGIFLGASATIKWNGLGFLLGIYLLIFMVYISPGFQGLFELRNLEIFAKIKLLKPWLLLCNFCLVPVFTYAILWLPYLLLNSEYSFWEIHQKIWSFHQSIGNSSDVHPYCSKWYSWLIMARPIAYFYQTKNTPSGTIIHDVHAMGNPILWWLATGAIIILSLFILIILVKQTYNSYFAFLSFILINYFANLLPWMLVSRCTFLYHYMSAYSFSLLAISLIIEQCLISSSIFNRRLGIFFLLLITFAFIYWLPIYLGLPLSSQEFTKRMLPNWI
ncbi:phospholipid carrier-dependent glycosyltransferase [Crocosphaera sp.]|uniref:phospholipid carrier-dependent glycosyltransferase n=1 Tax=Crocosphaera sp. TaxID=2729996 RepID=UPI0026252300|nr:phospholipid carrier-dependent glycosyltransferase [Crocosphaera sp.]MDJ0578895.1 phospholipid carrier-dependent glycosyltransferase [Crocosphaera sp.]